MTPRALVLALLVLGCLERSAAGADLLVPVSQTRTVSAHVQVENPGNTDEESASAPEFGPFDAAVSAQLGAAAASAQQHSSIGPDGAMANGSMTGTESSGVPGTWADASSRFQLTFDVLQPVAFTLVGEISLFATSCCTPPQGSFVRLTGGPGDQMIVNQFTHDGLFDFSEAGWLLPGQYTLLGDSSAYSVEGRQIWGSYDFVFTLVPEPSTGLLLAGGLLGLAALRPRARS